MATNSTNTIRVRFDDIPRIDHSFSGEAIPSRIHRTSVGKL
jgi:hypothetical protein